MNWLLEGMKVTGKYMGEIPVSGKVRMSRVAYGGDIKHVIVLDTPVEVYGEMRDTVILEHYQIETVRDN